MQGWHGLRLNPGCLCFLELLVSFLQLLVWNLDVVFFVVRGVGGVGCEWITNLRPMGCQRGTIYTKKTRTWIGGELEMSYFL